MEFLQLTKLARARLATNVGIVAFGSGGRLVLQILLFVAVARMLGATDYGAFVSVTLLVAIISTFSGLACEIVVVKAVSRDPARLERRAHRRQRREPRNGDRRHVDGCAFP